MDYSVGLYKNINENTHILVPNGFNEHGIRCNINKPVVLTEPYDTALLAKN
ncbi:hypothetical protein [Robertmurraya sp. P23]|uniref:hypothetical protein n=1 Tax=Robertmurraya sp. P23 TaxID=3436931 RepID=UPI003D983195